MPAPDVPLARANTARSRAVAERSAALLAITSGAATVWDVMRAATTHQSLGKVRLRQLLLAQDGWSPAHVNAALRRTVRTAGLDSSAVTGWLNIDWLLDPRVRGRRLLAFADAVAPDSLAPWPGFPFTPIPTTHEEVAATWVPTR